MGFGPRIDVENGWYHVMNRGVNRQPVFFGDEDRILFGRLLQRAHDRFGVEVHAYCLMTNHHHLLLHCPSAHLSDAMQLIGSVYTRETNERVGRDGPLFRGRFRSIPVATDGYLLAAVRYIHRNALDVADVAHPADHRWSSHRTYLGLRPSPEFLRLDRVLGYFGHDRAAFDRFVSAGPNPRCRIDPAALPAVIELVLDEVLGDDRAPRLDRTIMALLLDRLAPDDAELLEQQLGYASSDAAAAARRRARRRLLAEPVLGTVVERCLQLASRTQRL
jgi:REP element-mobilizing transposase RayT